MTNKRKQEVNQRLNRVQREIRERFSSSSMNNARWVQLLDALSNLNPEHFSVRVKLVTEDDPRPLCTEGRTRDFDYWRTGVEGMLEGYPHGWSLYLEWEWLEVTADGTEALTELLHSVESIGQLDVTVVDTVLRVTGYR